MSLNGNKSTNKVTAREALAELEAVKMTRRAALATFGIRAGAAVFAALSVDELSRLVLGELGRQAKSSQVAQKLAKEFRGAGVAFANPGGGGAPPKVACVAAKKSSACTSKTQWSDNCCYDNGPNSEPGNNVKNYCKPSGTSSAACRSCCRSVYNKCCTNPSYGGSGPGSGLATCLDLCSH